MSMQTMRLESKDGILIAEIRLPAHGEPDAIQWNDRFFIGPHRSADAADGAPEKERPGDVLRGLHVPRAGGAGLRGPLRRSIG